MNTKTKPAKKTKAEKEKEKKDKIIGKEKEVLAKKKST